MKLPLFMSLLLAWTTVNAKTISENFDASTDGTDVKIISHSMNYHMATFTDGSTTSSPRLVDRNKNRIEFQKLGEIKWIGLVPIFEFNDIDSYTDIVRSSENPTTIPSSKLPSYWKNSQLKITAGNLSSIVNEGPSAFGLFLLNLSEIPQMVADSSTNGKINITEKVEQNLDFINKFKKLQDFADDANAFITYLNLFVDTIDKISDAMDEAGIVDKPEFLTDSYEYLSYATTLSENALNAIGSLNPSSKIKSDMESVLFSKLESELSIEEKDDSRFGDLTIGADKTASKYLSSVLKEIPKKFTTPSEKEEIFYKVGQIVLEVMGEVLTIHQKNKLAKLDKDSSTYKEDYNKIALSIVEARLAIGVAVVGTSLFRNDIKDSQKYAGKYLLALANDAFQVLGSHLVNVSETLASNAIDPAMSKFGAGAGLAKVAKGVQIGNTIANQLIPFLYDLGLGESSASVDIADGEISLFGELDTKIIIRNTDGDIVWSSTYNNNDPKIYTDKGNTFTVELYAKQDDLFDNSERSPWDVHTELPPSDIHSSSINYGSDKSFLKLCMIKTWFSSYIDFYSNSGGRNLGTTLFSKISKTGTNISPADWSCAVKNTFTSSQTTKYGLDDLKQDDLSHLKLKTHDKPLLSKVIQVTDFNENLFISVNSYDDNDFFKTIQFLSNDDRLQYMGQSQVHFDNSGTISLDFNKAISSSSLSKIKIFDGYYQEPRLLSESKYELIVDGNSLIVKIKNPEKHHNYLVHLEDDVVAEDGATISENIEIDLQYVDYLSLEVSNSLECKQTGVCQFKIGYTSNMAEKLFLLNYGYGDNEVDTLNAFSSSEEKQYQVFTKNYPRSDSFNVVFQVYDDPSDTTPYLLEEITVQVDDIVDLLPTTPTNLVSAPDDGLVTLNWSSNEANHRVHYATSSFDGLDVANYNLASNYISVDVTSGTSTVIENLTNGTKYYFVVTTLKDGKESGASNEVSATPKMEVIPTGKLNDTGITWGGNLVNNNIDCTGEVLSQQDCSHGRDSQSVAGTLQKIGDGSAGFDFTKLGVDGASLASDSTSWSCIQDNVTGLIWEVKTNDNGLHNKDDRYTWYNTNSNTNGGSVGYQDYRGDICYDYQNNNPDSYCNTEAFINRVNTTKLCGKSNWRLPSINELIGIAHNGRSSPAIDINYFPNTNIDGAYWSSTPDAYDNEDARNFYSKNGSDGDWYRNFGGLVRLVSGGGEPSTLINTPDDRYTVNDNGTVLDKKTMLMWKKCSEGLSGNDCSTGNISTHNWKSALQLAQSDTTADYDDWRLPNIKELRSLVSYDHYNPSINSSIFPNTINNVNYWTSSPHFNTVSDSWFMNFFTGSDGNSDRYYSNFAVRLVRSESEGSSILHNGFTYKPITSPHTGKVWLDRNLGANRVCQNYRDSECFGDYYQWGRQADGHEKQDSQTTIEQAISISNAGNKFVEAPSSPLLYSGDWALNADTDGSLRANSWSSLDGTSICPTGYRVPSFQELANETINLTNENHVGNVQEAFGSFLKIPSAKHRHYLDGSLSGQADFVYLWSSTASNNYALHLHITTNSFDEEHLSESGRGSAESVRCIKN